jgi:arylsulfatase A-like enzyme
MVRPALTFLALLVTIDLAPAAAPAKPNLVLLLADDLGYGDLSCFGQTKFRTPNLDRLAKDGMRFTQFYAGSTVCAPSRCTLMTGRHTGHCLIRGNGRQALGPGDRTVAEVLKAAGYRTGLFGKWGLGEEGSSGVPTQKGFDAFFGYLNQHHAHNYFPDYLISGDSRYPLPKNVQSKTDNVAAEAVTYAPDLIAQRALEWLDESKADARPFFLYFATTLPHANNEKNRATKNGNEVPPGYAPFASEPWPQPEKDKAAMIRRLDEHVGLLLAKLKSLGVEDNTLILFSSDNGPHKEGGNDPAFFASSGPHRGIKRSLTDGGIRVPTIARWPAGIKPGTTSDHVAAFWDVLPTFADLAGTKAPAGIDGLTFAPTLTGTGDQKRHVYLYWEFHEGGTKRAVRYGNWKGIKSSLTGKLELYDVVADPHEDRDVAGANPDLVAKIEATLTTARTPSAAWPLAAGKKK